MAEEELRAAIDDSVLTHTGRSIGDRASQAVIDDIWPLIETRESALAAEVEAWRKIGRTIAEGIEPLGYSHEAGNYCVYCYADTSQETSFPQPEEHLPDCPVSQARALLGIGEGDTDA